MPQRKAAKKDLKQNKKNQQQNLQIKQKVKRAIKNLKKSINNADLSSRQQALNEVYKVLDKAAKKNIIHRNKAARKKSHFAKFLKSQPVADNKNTGKHKPNETTT